MKKKLLMTILTIAALLLTGLLGFRLGQKQTSLTNYRLLFSEPHEHLYTVSRLNIAATPQQLYVVNEPTVTIQDHNIRTVAFDLYKGPTHLYSYADYFYSAEGDIGSYQKPAAEYFNEPVRFEEGVAQGDHLTAKVTVSFADGTEQKFTHKLTLKPFIQPSQ